MGMERGYRCTCDVRGCTRSGPLGITPALAAGLAELLGWQTAGDVAVCRQHSEQGMLPDVEIELTAPVPLFREGPA